MQFSPVGLLRLQLSVRLLLGDEPGIRHLSQMALTICIIDIPSHHATPSTLMVGQLGWLGEWSQLDINRLQPPGLPTPNLARSQKSRTNGSFPPLCPGIFPPRADGPLRFAVQRHLGLPVFEADSAVGTNPSAQAADATMPLATTVTTFLLAPKVPFMRRHNRIRVLWIQLCRRAGLHTDPEQLVYIAAGETKRASRLCHSFSRRPALCL